MSISQMGYTGLSLAIVAASTLKENLGVTLTLILILVALSTLMIRITSTIRRTTRDEVRITIRKMQTDGDLPTNRERVEVLKALATLVEYNETEKQ